MSGGAKKNVSVSAREQVLLAEGRRVGRLVVKGLNRNGDVLCDCDCGETMAVTRGVWMSGKRYQCASCDEWSNATPVQQIIGCRDTYDTLMSRARGAKDRCENPKNPNYGNYGAIGVRFLFADEEAYALCLFMHGWRYGDERTTDRIDVNGNYEFNNVRLADASEQVRNRRVSVVVDTGDEVVPLATLAEQNGISPTSPEYSRLSGFVKKSKQRVFDDIMGKIDELTGAEAA